MVRNERIVKWFPPPKMIEVKEEVRRTSLPPMIVPALAYIPQTKNTAPNPSKNVERMTALEKRQEKRQAGGCFLC